MISHALKKIMLLMTILLLAACATMPPKAPVRQQKGDYDYLKTYMTWFIQQQMKEKDIVGLSIALVDDQQIIWKKGFGYADRENKIIASPDTIYRAGSISKLFNGMAAMKLAEAGKMDIDRPLVTYLPDFKIKSRFGPTDGITPRTLMTHHSGLPSDWLDGMWDPAPRHFTELVHLIKDEYVATPPNTVMSYSNLGVTLLGHAIQNCSRQEYAAYLDESLLNPMGMTDSRFETGITGARAAKSYNDDKEIIEYPLGDIPAGGLNTTAIDLARLAMMVNGRGKLQDRRILASASLDEMFTIQNKDVPLDLGRAIGLAWGISEKQLPYKEPVYHHSGAVIGHRATFWVAPRSKLGVVVLSNSAQTNTSMIAGKLIKMAWESKHGEKLPEPSPSVNKTAHGHKVYDFNGTFATLIGKADVTEKSTDHFKVKSSMGNFTLKRGKDNQYHLSYRLWGLIPIDLEELGEAALTAENISGNHVIIAQLPQGRILGGKRVDPYKIHAAWERRLGQYKLMNPPALEFWKIEGMELRIEDGYLVAATPDNGDEYAQILRTVNDREAIEEGFGRGLGETVRVIEDETGSEILTVSGLRYKRMEN